MELTAAANALKKLERRCRVKLFSDSEYLQKAFTEGWLLPVLELRNVADVVVSEYKAHPCAATTQFAAKQMLQHARISVVSEIILPKKTSR